MAGTQRAIGPLRQQRGPAVRQAVAGALRRGGFEQFARQILNQHLLPGGHHRQPAAGILQLAHVARPGQAGQCGFGFRMQVLGLYAQLLGGDLQEVARQPRDVFPALAQRRQVYADHVQAVEQILAELAFLYPQFQVLVRGGDDAHVDLHRRIAADSVKLAVRQHPQQARLHVERHIADLVEEQRAAVGLFKAPLTDLVRAGEGAFLVAEQLGLDQILGNSGHVQGDERRLGARAVAVQRMRHQLFAGAGFAVDQHADRRTRQPADDAKHVLHRRRFADDVRRRIAGRLAAHRLLLLLIMADGALDQRHRFVDVERFRQVVEGPLLIGADGRIQIRMRGHDDHRQHRVALFDLLEQRQTIDARHADVGQQHVGSLRGQGFQHVIAAFEGGAAHARAGERTLKHPADGAIVIDDPDYPSLHCKPH
ncbi:Uncharacterized protein conserved in bacteria [Acinetobacter baumannii]|nr:Uncharacterized protein conserved in bacteria [Acinetobacter baumannii]